VVTAPGARAELRRWLVDGAPPEPREESEAEALVAAAEEQGLAGLLLRALPEGDGAWPAEARGRLRARAQWLLARGVRQLDLAARACGILAGRGLRALPLKGAALLESLYASPAERPMADVDLLVLDDWPEAHGLLRDAGYEEVDRADHAAVLLDPQGAGVLELHWSVTSCPGLFPASAGLWERSLPGSGQVPRRPGGEDLLVQLALHAAFQHGLVLSLVQWLDFRRLLEGPPAPDLGRAREIAREVGGETALGMALHGAALVVGSPAPAWSPQKAMDPLSLVIPSVPRLARRRLEVAAGRRGRLLRETLLPRTPGARPGPWAQAGLGVRRLRAVLPQLGRYPWGA
jgi:hypothetical protein